MTSAWCINSPFLKKPSLPLAESPGRWTSTRAGKAFGIALHPKGSFLYTGNSSSNTVSVFAVASTGLLTLKSQASANVSNPVSLAVDLQGKFLYVANFGNSTVAQFSINQTTGALSPIGVGKVPTENPPKSATGPITIVTTLAPPTITKVFSIRGNRTPRTP